MKHVLSVIFAAIVFISPLLSPLEASPGSPDSSLKIGFVLPLSGDWAFLGNGIRDGAILASEDLKAHGVDAKLIFMDNRGELSASSTVATRLIAEEKVNSLVSIISGVGKILKPLAQRASIVNIAICSDTEVADGTHSFINYLTAEQGVAKFIEHFNRALPKKSLGILSLNESGFDRIINELERQAAGQIAISRIERYNRGTTDFRSLLIRMRRFKPDSLLLLGLSPEIELLARQARELGINIPLTSIESFGLAADKHAFEGSWFIDAAVPSDSFQERFLNRYGREVTAGVGHAYDSVMLLGEAFKAGERSGASLSQALTKISDYDGTIGNLSVKKDGVIWSEASVKEIRGGRMVGIR